MSEREKNKLNRTAHSAFTQNDMDKKNDFSPSPNNTKLQTQKHHAKPKSSFLTHFFVLALQKKKKKSYSVFFPGCFSVKYLNIQDALSKMTIKSCWFFFYLMLKTRTIISQCGQKNKMNSKGKQDYFLTPLGNILVFFK